MKSTEKCLLHLIREQRAADKELRTKLKEFIENGESQARIKYGKVVTQEAHQLVGRQNTAAPEFDPKPSEAAFSTDLSL